MLCPLGIVRGRCQELAKQTQQLLLEFVRGVPSVFHHLYNFGNVPMFITFSTNRHINEAKADGSIVKRHFLDFNITMDDRICDGQYYSEALHDFRKYLKNPELLEVPPKEVIQDIP